jgi:hypothetical protein
MTRMRLGWSADSTGSRPGGLSPFKIMVILTIVYFAVNIFVGGVTDPYLIMSRQGEIHQLV